MDEELLIDLEKLSKNPVGFVYWAFPWGEADTELADYEGPDEWALWVLNQLAEGLLTVDEAIQIAIASGHGIGKSALVAWIILWAFSTKRGTRGVVTANTENQLKTKTWVELSKWFRLFIAKSLFKLEATKLYSADAEMENEWRIDMVPWSERNTEAFAGLHNKGKRILVVFDEASSIPDLIWETTEGALTDKNTEILWLVFGNPTKSVGRFKECFPGGRHAGTWRSRAVDSRTVKITNKKQIAKWIAAYGEDSDFVRVRVKGEFPRVGAMEFIPISIVEEAQTREVTAAITDPLVMSVDVARFGDDASCIFFRKGRDARSIPPIILRGVDTMTLAARAAEEYMKYNADALFVDGGGVGGGVVDRLRQLQIPCFDVQFGSSADRGSSGASGTDDGTRYFNKRAEMWGFMRDWLKTGAIPNDKDLQEELVGPMYSFSAKDEIQLERKVDMKRRGLSSPDRADALALTFAYPVFPNRNAGGLGSKPTNQCQTEYDPYGAEHV